jgi:septum site-determining protein MinC
MSSKPTGESNAALLAKFEIKSAQLPVVALFLKSNDAAQLARDLLAEFGPGSESSDFFESEPVVFDFSTLDPMSDCPDLHALSDAAKACGLVPVAFRAAPQAWRVTLAQQGWVEAPAEVVKVKAEGLRKSPLAPSVAPQAHEPLEASAEPAAPAVPEIRALPTMVIDKPLRSGQKVYARGADLVVLAMVNQGAEVVADGNIHVYAPLRGKAMAGARGNALARIFSLCLEPELISIAGVYRTSENPLPKDIAGKAAQVRLSSDGQDKLIIEALKT